MNRSIRITVQELDELVEKTYGRIYCFQQQDDCKERGSEYHTVPELNPTDYDRDNIPEIVNHPMMGVSFKAWLERDPQKKLNTNIRWDYENGLELWWHRNFYPHVSMVLNDLYEKGLIEAGNYCIVIDW